MNYERLRSGFAAGNYWMLRRSLIALGLGLLFAGRSSGDDRAPVRPPAPVPVPPPTPEPVVPPNSMLDPRRWAIGPVIDGHNHSRGMPLNPEAHVDGWAFSFPLDGGDVHYVTTPSGSIVGARAMKLDFRIEALPDVKLVPLGFAGKPASVSLYFQRAGDNWEAEGGFATYRWYSPKMFELVPGDTSITVALDDPGWISVYAATSWEMSSQFIAAKENCGTVGMTFGGGFHRGHGV